jgi:hypothetical protein
MDTYTKEILKQERIADKLLHAVTAYDEKQSTKKGYNMYALSQYIGAINERVIPALESGTPLRQAILKGFCGRLLDVCLKAVGEPKSTDAEQRGSLSDYGY